MNHDRSRTWIFASLATAIGAALRLWFVHAYPVLDGDPLVYGDIAKNWLLHGVYGLSSQLIDGTAVVHPTLIRLPGYPLFVAICFKLFGIENYRAVLYLQVLVDLASCFFIAGFVRRMWGARAAGVALWLGALCPFTSNYVAVPLTETLSVFCVALAFHGLLRLLENPTAGRLLVLAGAVSYAALLRPDGALLGVVLIPAIVIYGRRQWGAAGIVRALKLAAICGAISVLPFIAWTIRNYRTFNVFEPLAPRYAVDPGESATPGFNRWMKTWCVEFTSTYEIYWNANTDKLDIANVPARAFDSAEQQQRTAELFEDYNQTATLTPAIDDGFAAVAAERIRGHWLRYYFELPLLRVLDMGLRPRTESLPIDLRWWKYGEHPAQTIFAAGYAALNLAYITAAIAGLLRWPRLAGAMAAFIVLRCLLLATLEAPESRYTLELFPVLMALAASALSRRSHQDAGHSLANDLGFGSSF
ncbi:MAG TPA: glycosyltransferase family 39 protein [Acidisarcina sp.]